MRMYVTINGEPIAQAEDSFEVEAELDRIWRDVQLHPSEWCGMGVEIGTTDLHGNVLWCRRLANVVE